MWDKRAVRMREESQSGEPFRLLCKAVTAGSLYLWVAVCLAAGDMAVVRGAFMPPGVAPANIPYAQCFRVVGLKAQP